MKDYKGQYLLAVEGNAPTKDGGVYCTVGGESFLKYSAGDRKGRQGDCRLGSCASNGCVQAAKPNPSGAQPIKDLVSGKPIINVPAARVLRKS
jgi:hydrogenase small subunit